MPLNATLNATLDYIGDLDVFRIVVPRAGKLSIGSHGTDASGAFLDTMAILLQSDGSCMPDPAGKGECNNNATNDDATNTSPRDTNFLIKDIDVQAGTYYVSVGMWDPQATTPNGYQIYSIFAATLTPQTITFANPGSRALSSGTVAANAVATSGLAVTLSSITPSVCNIAGANIVFTAAGVCTVAADQAGDANFGVATQVKQSFFVYPAQALAKRGAIDIDGNNKSVLIVRSAGGQMLAGRFSSNLPGAGQFTFTSQADPGAAFRLVGAIDFDGNGKTDLAFQNPSLLDSLGRADVLAWDNFVPPQRLIRPVKPAWIVQAVGDLDGDGLGDMVFRWTGFTADRPDDTGVSYIWFATGVNGAGEPVVRKRGGAPLSWTLLGAADLNGDGAADIIYISPDGAIRALMATPGRTCANFSAGTMPVGYSALKLADFTGQRRGDILIRNAAGTTSLLSLNAVGLVLPPFVGDPTNINASCTASSQIIASTAISLPATDPSWQFYASGDFDGDGIFDMVWMRPDGTLTVWLMGNNGVVLNVISNAGTAPAGYTVFQP